MKKAIRHTPKPLTLDEKDRLAGTGKEIDYLRALRKPLLKAFDIYKSNVYYGIIEETQEEHNAILQWYHTLLDIEGTAPVILADGSPMTAEEAIRNIPEKIKRYIK